MRGARGLRDCLLLVMCLITLMLSNKGEIFSSVSKLKTLPKLERQLLSKFQEFLHDARDDPVTLGLRGKIRKIWKSNSKSLENTSSLECPLHAFRLIKRLVRQWSAIFRLSPDVASSSDEKLRDFVNSTKNWITKQEIWPSYVDLRGAAEALVRLHHLYLLDYSTLLRGRFLNMTSSPVTSLELSYIIKAALNLGFICDAKELFSALETLSWREGARMMNNVSFQRLKEKLANKAAGFLSDCPLNYGHLDASIESLRGQPEEQRKASVRALYHQMCRQAVRAEVVNSDPFIAVFHKVLSDREIKEVINLSFGKLTPSTLAVAQVAHEQKLIRVSQNAWLFDWSPVVFRISQRVQLITGLSTRLLHEDTHAEPYQVLNYGLGGVYGPHEDSVRIPRHNGNEDTPLLRNSGDRTATWMYYLSDVTLGGATVFPLLGAGVHPQKGSAVFWYNLKRNGEGDVRMVHAGCPVLYGDKWVANKWLREVGSTFTRPCLLEPNL